MPMVFACSVSHTPGIRAWPDAPDTEIKEQLYKGFSVLRKKMLATEPETLLIISSEHFTNFFLDCMPAFTIGQAKEYFGPVEPWIKIKQGTTIGDPSLSKRLLDACYKDGIELAYSHEMKLDHGTMIPLSFLDPTRELPIIPLIINAMTYPMPTQKRCYELEKTLYKALKSEKKRVAVIAAGGLSHAPGEHTHGKIDAQLDREFIRLIVEKDVDTFTSFTDEELESRGLGTHEIRTWVTLAGVAKDLKATPLFYEPIPAWATGCGLLCYD
ncbi:MAG: hypothetical protein MK009_00170 [Gammaproteobacteria bacterium]|nr:hypothetical protein [Gammaproteobacteria bacterium]